MITPDGSLERDVAAAVLRHPAGRRRVIGFQRVELAPGVYVAECVKCGVLLRIGPGQHLLTHHQAHRSRVRWLLAATQRYVRALFTRS